MGFNFGGFLRALGKLFGGRRPPTPEQWQIGMHVQPTTATVEITLPEGAVMGRVANEHGHRIFSFSSPPYKKTSSGTMIARASGYVEARIPLSAPFSTVPDIQLARSVVHRTGRVQLQERTFTDDGGPYFSLGATYFPSPWKYANELDLYRDDLDTLKAGEVDYIRSLAVVGWNGPEREDSWSDRTSDPRDPAWLDSVVGSIDLAYERGLKTQLTIFGGIETTPDPGAREAVVTRLAAALKDRAHKIQLYEVANEGSDLGWGGLIEEMKRYVRFLRRETGNLVAPTSVSYLQVGPNEFEPDTRYFGEEDILPFHLDRDTTGEGGLWRPVRQAREPLQVTNKAWSNQEFWRDEDPERQAMAAFVTAVCNGTTYIFHQGAGIRAGGRWDTSDVSGSPRDLPKTIAEVPNVQEIFGALRDVRSLMPPDLPNWRWENGNRAGAHSFPFDGNVLEANDTRHLRFFVAISGSGEFVLTPLRITGEVPCIAVRPMTFTVWQPYPKRELETVTLAAGDRWVPPLANALILKGTLR